MAGLLGRDTMIHRDREAQFVGGHRRANVSPCLARSRALYGVLLCFRVHRQPGAKSRGIQNLKEEEETGDRRYLFICTMNG